MKNIFSKLSKPSDPPSLPPRPLNEPVSRRDVFRYRRQYGVNLGAWFVAERWINDSLFVSSPTGSSELSAVRASLDHIGLAQTRQKWEHHWRTWITTEDLHFLKSVGINSVRIPIGYFSLSKAGLCQNTEFEDVREVYVSSWEILLAFIRSCNDFDIGVLIDLHCLPGGANPDSHSGTDSKKADFFSRYIDLGVSCVRYIIDQVKDFENIIGVQVINEASWGTDKKAEKYYSQCIDYANRSGGVPIYISDGWNLEYWSKWLSGRPEFVVIDHHYYHCFTPKDHGRSIRDHIRDLEGDRKQLAECQGLIGRDNIIVGEWSCALNGTSKEGFSAEDLATEMRRFASEQAKIYSSTGSFFWTYKFRVRNGKNEWEFRDMIRNFTIPPVPMNEPTGRDEKYASHCAYWDSRGSSFEHWRYLDGWNQASLDIAIFQRHDSSLGFSKQWLSNRRAAHIAEKGEGRLNCLWEFEAGYEQCLASIIA